MKIISLAFFFLILTAEILSAQMISAYDHMQEKDFETEIPDSLFVVFGERVRNSSNDRYIDQTEFWAGYDIFLLNEPWTLRVIQNDEFGSSAPKRIDLESNLEVFFGEDYSNDFDLRYNLNIYDIRKSNRFSKFGPVENIKIKKIKLIFLDLYGNRISADEYYQNKFILEYMLEHITLVDSQGNILNNPKSEERNEDP